MEFKNLKEFKTYFKNALESGQIQTITYDQWNPFYLQHCEYNKTTPASQIINLTLTTIHIKTLSHEIQHYPKSYYSLPYKQILKINGKPIKIN